MSITPERKKELHEQYAISSNDTGSAHVQVAVLTERIRNLTEHLKSNKKDFASRLGLMKMVGRRTTLLRYLAKKNHAEYQKLIQSLGLRR